MLITPRLKLRFIRLQPCLLLFEHGRYGFRRRGTSPYASLHDVRGRQGFPKFFFRERQFLLFAFETKRHGPVDLLGFGVREGLRNPPVLAYPRHDQNRLTGNIRIGGMPGFMQQQVVPLLVEFQKSYPDIQFDVVCNEDPETLLNGQCDVMLYYGSRPRKGLVEHWVTRSLFVACAAPEYLAERGKPLTPADLAQHSGIIFTGSCRPHSDILKLGQEETHYRWKSQLRFNNILSAKTAALKGAGVMLDCPAHHGYEDILKGT